MHKLFAPILLLTALGSQAAFSQVTLSNGSQSGVVNAPTTPAPAVQAPTGMSASTGVSAPAPIAPQMPTTTNLPGAPPAIATPQQGASPGVPVLNAPTNQAAPSPAP